MNRRYIINRATLGVVTFMLALLENRHHIEVKEELGQRVASLLRNLIKLHEQEREWNIIERKLKLKTLTVHRARNSDSKHICIEVEEQIKNGVRKLSNIIQQNMGSNALLKRQIVSLLSMLIFYYDT